MGARCRPDTTGSQPGTFTRNHYRDASGITSEGQRASCSSRSWHSWHQVRPGLSFSPCGAVPPASTASAGCALYSVGSFAWLVYFPGHRPLFVDLPWDALLYQFGLPPKSSVSLQMVGVDLLKATSSPSTVSAKGAASDEHFGWTSPRWSTLLPTPVQNLGCTYLRPSPRRTVCLFFHNLSGRAALQQVGYVTTGLEARGPTASGSGISLRG